MQTVRSSVINLRENIYHDAGISILVRVKARRDLRIWSYFFIRSSVFQCVMEDYHADR
jgi:hypothetical protein